MIFDPRQDDRTATAVLWVLVLGLASLNASRFGVLVGLSTMACALLGWSIGRATVRDGDE